MKKLISVLAISVFSTIAFGAGKDTTMNVLKVCKPVFDKSLPTVSFAVLPKEISEHHSLVVFATSDQTPDKIFMLDLNNYSANLGEYPDIYFSRNDGSAHPEINLVKKAEWRYSMISITTPRLPSTNGYQAYDCQTPQ